MTLGRDDPDPCVASAVVRRVSQAITHPRGTIHPRVTESMAEQMGKWASALPRILFCYVPSSSQCVTPARDLHWQGWGTQDSQLPLNFMVFTEMCFQVG